MRALIAAQTWADFESLIDKTGPLVTLSFAATGMGVSRRWVYQMADEGRLSVYAVEGQFFVAARDVVLMRKRAGHFTTCEVTDLEVAA